MTAFRYGLGFSGYNGVLAFQQVQRNQATRDSRDWLYDPRDGKWVRRGGSVTLGDTTPDAEGQLILYTVLPGPG